MREKHYFLFLFFFIFSMILFVKIQIFFFFLNSRALFQASKYCQRQAGAFILLRSIPQQITTTTIYLDIQFIKSTITSSGVS